MVPSGTCADVLRECGVQAWKSTRLGRDGAHLDPHIRSGIPRALVSHVHMLRTSVHQPHNRQQVGWSCFIWNWQGPSPWLPHPPRAWRGARAGRGGRAAGIGGPEELQAPPAPIREEADLPPGYRTVWVRCSGSDPSPLSPTQLRLLELQEAPLYRASWMAWKSRPPMAKIEGSGGRQGCHPQSEGATGGHQCGGLRATWSRAGARPGRQGRWGVGVWLGR